jgi:hypothetical protein
VSRQEGLAASAAVVARHVPDLAGLALALDAAGLGRLAAALRARPRAGKRPTVLAGAPRPDPAVWAAQAGRVVGGGP